MARRHGPLVWAVSPTCFRITADAEDAFQAVFLALGDARRACRDGRARARVAAGVAVRIATRASRLRPPAEA